MQSLLLEEIDFKQMEILKRLLAERSQPSALPGAYWLPVPEDLLNAGQKEHLSACGPYCLALLLEEGDRELKLELLVRACNNLHCPCIQMADKQQRDMALNFWDSLLAALYHEERNGPGH